MHRGASSFFVDPPATAVQLLGSTAFTQQRYRIAGHHVLYSPLEARMYELATAFMAEFGGKLEDVKEDLILIDNDFAFVGSAGAGAVDLVRTLQEDYAQIQKQRGRGAQFTLTRLTGFT